MILQWRSNLPIFEQYAVLANLRLNLPKTFLIPLFLPENFALAKARTLARIPQAADMAVELSATHLGVNLGPAGYLQGWDKPLRKYVDRVERWSGIHTGTFYDVRVYNVFCASVLQFYLKFYELPPSLRTAELKAMRRIFVGPGGWITDQDVASLPSQLGAPLQFSFSRQRAIAAAMRLLLAEPYLRDCH